MVITIESDRMPSSCIMQRVMWPCRFAHVNLVCLRAIWRTWCAGYGCHAADAVAGAARLVWPNWCWTAADPGISKSIPKGMSCRRAAFLSVLVMKHLVSLGVGTVPVPRSESSIPLTSKLVYTCPGLCGRKPPVSS